MNISFTPEIEARLQRMASESGKETSQFVQELVAKQLDYDEWFVREVGKGLASLDDGKSFPHEEALLQIQRLRGL